MLFAVFDTETTGLPYHRDADVRNQPRVIEFAGIITDGDRIITEEHFICDPGMPIEQIITDITGLTNADLKGQPPFKEFVPRLWHFFNGAAGRIAHNLSFDKNLLDFDCRRAKLDLRDISWDESDEGPAIEICTVEQSFFKYGRRMKLNELYNLLVEPYVQSHRAMADVEALHAVAQRLGVYEAVNAMEVTNVA